MIFEIIRGGGTDWVGKEWAGLLFPRGKNGPKKNWLGGNSGLLHQLHSCLQIYFFYLHCIGIGKTSFIMKSKYNCINNNGS